MLFVADTGNHIVRVVDVLHRTSRTLAGGKSQPLANGQSKALVYPRGLAVVAPHQVTCVFAITAMPSPPPSFARTTD